LMIDPKEIALPAPLTEADKTRWIELFKYPRLVAAGCLTGLTQTGGASLALWGPTVLVLVLQTSPEHAAYLTIFSTMAAGLRPRARGRAGQSLSAVAPPRSVPASTGRQVRRRAS
jgi:hypothetical protein